MTTATADAKHIPTRRISFEEELQSLPKHFAADGNIVASHVVAMLSAVFPDGEDYFVRSVRRYRGDIEDPVLKKQVGGFIGQEAVHGREHRMFNDRLAELGYQTNEVAWFTKHGLAIREKLSSGKMNLAATASLEHYTATLAEVLLTDDNTRRMIGHDGVQHLFLWHALEESEHKAVAFDVYRAVGGTERTRIWTHRLMTVGFLTGMTLSVIISMLQDRKAWNPIRVARHFRKAVRMELFTKETWRKLMAYNREGFHPDDFDTRELEAEWRERFFGEYGELNDRLTSGQKAA